MEKIDVISNKNSYEITVNNHARVYTAFFLHVFYLFLTADQCRQFEIVCSNILTADG